jgi:CyaY protein
VDPQTFETLAHDTLDRLNEMLSEALGEQADVDLQSDGVLVVEFEDGWKFVINSHRVARQMWVAAFASAWHFDPPGWRTARGEELIPTLEGILEKKLGRPVKLPPLGVGVA